MERELGPRKWFQPRKLFWEGKITWIEFGKFFTLCRQQGSCCSCCRLHCKKMIDNSICVACKSIFSSKGFSIFEKKCFLEIYSRGVLNIPSANLWEFVCEAFSILGCFDKIILKFPWITAKKCCFEWFGSVFALSEICLWVWKLWKLGHKLCSKSYCEYFLQQQENFLTDNVRKDQLNFSKKRQRSKSK